MCELYLRAIIKKTKERRKKKKREPKAQSIHEPNHAEAAF